MCQPKIYSAKFKNQITFHNIFKTSENEADYGLALLYVKCALR